MSYGSEYGLSWCLFHVHLERICLSAAAGWSFVEMSIRSRVYLSNNYLVLLIILEMNMTVSKHNCGFFYLSLFIAISFNFMYLWLCCFRCIRSYTFKTTMFSWLISLAIIIQDSLFPSGKFFLVPKSTLCNNIVTPAVLHLVFPWHIFFVLSF